MRNPTHLFSLHFRPWTHPAILQKRFHFGLLQSSKDVYDLDLAPCH